MLGDLQSLCVQSNEDPDGFAESLKTWLTIEDDEMVRLDEIEMVMEEEKQCTSHEECHTVLESTSDPPTNSESGTHTNDESNKELSEVNRKGILNSTDLDESLRMVENIMHLTSSLQEDDTTSMLTKVYHTVLKLKKEKLELNTRQTVIRDFFKLADNTLCTEQPMNT